MKLKKSIMFFATSLFLIPSLHAEEKTKPKIYAYDYWAYKTAHEFIDQMDQNTDIKQLSAQNPNGDLQCMPVFKNSIKNGVLDIRYALGYFDDSQGIDIMYDGFNYGLSPSLDVEVFHILRRALTDTCDTPTKQLCGFKETGNPASGLVELSKNVNILGSNVLVKITLTHASASESFTDNKGPLADTQKALTLQSEQNYFDHIGISDVVIYNGHSRNGGGPDFNPPLLDKHLHVDYDGYYRVKKPGITRVLNQMKKNPNKDFILGLFACYSQKHYYSALTKVNKNQRMVLSIDTIDYFDSLHASLGLMESLLRGQCGDNTNKFIQLTEKLSKGYKAFQIK